MSGETYFELSFSPVELYIGWDSKINVKALSYQAGVGVIESVVQSEALYQLKQ